MRLTFDGWTVKQIALPNGTGDQPSPYGPELNKKMEGERERVFIDFMSWDIIFSCPQTGTHTKRNNGSDIDLNLTH